MRIANIVTPGSEYQTPPQEEIAPDVTVVHVLTRAHVLLATDPIRIVLRDLVYVEAALRAEADGNDAVFVNTVGDFGLELMRSALGIPAVGAGEAAVRRAIDLAPRFSIVSVWPSSTRTNYDRVLDATGTADRCVSVHHVLGQDEVGSKGGGAGVMDAVRREGNPVADRVLRSCQDATKEGAGAIVLGCSCMAGLTGFLQRHLDVPVVDPLSVGYAATEAAAREGASRAGGSPAGPVTQDTVARIESAVAAWESLGASVPAAWADDCGDTCSVLAGQGA